MKAYIKIFSIFLFCFIWACAPKTIKQTEIPRPDTGSELFPKAEKLFQEKAYDEALSAYNEYLFRSSNRSYAPDALIKTGMIYSLKKEYSKARDSYEHLLSLYPDSPYISDARFEILVTLYNEGKYDDLIKKAKKALSLPGQNPYSLRIYMLLGDAYSGIGSQTEAIDTYILAYKISKDIEKNNIFEKIKKTINKSSPKELTSMLSSMEGGTFQAYIMYTLGEKLANEGNIPEAKKIFSAYIEKFPDDKNIEDVKNKMANLKEAPSFDQFTIGVLLPLSGEYSKYGEKALKGIEFALHQFNTEGSPQQQIKLLIKDSTSDANKTVQAVNELADGKVTAIIGPLNNVEVAAAKAQEKEIPIITLTQKDNIPQIGDYVFRNFFTPKMQVNSIVTYAVQKLGIKRFAILYPGETYGTTFMNLFQGEVSAYGAEIVTSLSYKVGETDFANTIKSLRGGYKKQPKAKDNDGTKSNVGFDALFIPDAPKTAGLIIPQLAYYDINNIYLLGTNLWHSDSFIKMSKENVQGAIMPDMFFVNSSSEVVKKFVDSFQATFQEKPDFIEATTYDTAMILFQMVTRPDIKNRNDIKDALMNLRDYQGVTGLTSFDNTGEVHKKLYILRVEGDNFVEIDNQ